MQIYHPDSEEHALLLASNGKRVTMPNGLRAELQVRTWRAIYPYEHRTISASLSLVDKGSDADLATKRELGDDWSTDYFESGIEFQLHILAQLENRHEQPV